jgi:small conductance mechanosensitive channel
MENIQPLEILLTRFVEFLPSLITAIVIFIVTLFLASWLANPTAKAMKRRAVNFNVTGFVAGLGIVGFTVGFALQDVTKNFVAGILLLVQQPFDIADSIQVTGYSGVVKDITLRTTEIRTWDGRDVLIPNGDVYVKPITNYSRDPRRRLELSVSVSKEWDLEQLTDTVLGSLRGGEGVLDEPDTEAVWTTSTEATTELSAYYWVDTSQVDLRSAQNSGLAAVRAALNGEAEDFSFSVKAPLPDAP